MVVWDYWSIGGSVDRAWIVDVVFEMSSYNKKAIEYLKASGDARKLLRKAFPQI